MCKLFEKRNLESICNFKMKLFTREHVITHLRRGLKTFVLRLLGLQSRVRLKIKNKKARRRGNKQTNTHPHTNIPLHKLDEKKQINVLMDGFRPIHDLRFLHLGIMLMPPKPRRLTPVLLLDLGQGTSNQIYGRFAVTLVSKEILHALFSLSRGSHQDATGFA